jgi:hypothetical protein
MGKIQNSSHAHRLVAELAEVLLTLRALQVKPAAQAVVEELMAAPVVHL